MMPKTNDTQILVLPSRHTDQASARACPWRASTPFRQAQENSSRPLEKRWSSNYSLLGRLCQPYIGLFTHVWNIRYSIKPAGSRQNHWSICFIYAGILEISELALIEDSSAKPCILLTHDGAAQQNGTEDTPAMLLQEALWLLLQHLQKVKYQPSSACRPASEASLSSYPAAVQLPELPLPSRDAQRSVRCNATDEAAAEQNLSHATGSARESSEAECAEEGVRPPDSSALSRVRIAGASNTASLHYCAF